MASNLSNSNAQIRDIKELLLKLVNPTIPLPATHDGPTETSNPTNMTCIITTQASAPNCPPPDCPREERTAHGSAPSVPACTPGTLGTSLGRVRQHDGIGSRSWTSADTVPVTPKTMLQNFRNQMPIGAAVSTDISASIGTTSQEHSPRPPSSLTPASIGHQHVQVPSPRFSPPATFLSSGENGPAPEGVTTRGMSTYSDVPTLVRPPRLRFENSLLPRITSGAIAANCLVFILHPNCGNTVVAEGRSGSSWKSPKGKFGSLCSEGQQMVQVHKVIVPNLPLIHLEERHSFTTLDQVVVKPSGSSVYVKWDSRLLHRKSKTTQASSIGKQ